MFNSDFFSLVIIKNMISVYYIVTIITHAVLATKPGRNNIS